MRVLNVFRGEALHERPSSFGTVGTVFSGEGLEVVWISKEDEAVDPGWFQAETVDVLLVLQGRLRMEFEDESVEDRTLEPGDVVVLEAGTRCRAYRWPRDAGEATIFLAVYPR